MAKVQLLVVAFALAVAVVAAEGAADGVTEKEFASMGKEQLVQELTKAHTKAKDTAMQLESAHNMITKLQAKLEEAKGTEPKVDEKEREAQEKKQKEDEKKREAARRQKKLEKKEKLSDVLMAHAAEFLAMKAAKDKQDSGNEKQLAAVKQAAEEGARAGAVGPLRKVVRATATDAVKKARAEAKKKGTHDKHTIRRLTDAAAAKAVAAFLAEQDKLVAKTVKETVKKALKKFPPSMFLADEDDADPTTNTFTAPPGIHLSLEGNNADAAKEVEELKQDSAKNEEEEVKGKTVHLKLNLKKKTKPSKDAKKKVAKAAAQAKQAAGDQIVPEN